MMPHWIISRRPTRKDGSVFGDILVLYSDGKVGITYWAAQVVQDNVMKLPWMHTPQTVAHNNRFVVEPSRTDSGTYNVWDIKLGICVAFFISDEKYAWYIAGAYQDMHMMKTDDDQPSVEDHT